MRLLISSLKVFFVKGFGAAAAFILTIVVTNTANIDEAGIFLFSTTLVTTLGMIFVIGAPQAIIRFVSANHCNGWDVINNHFSAIVKSIFLFGISIIVILYFLSDSIATHLFGRDELKNTLPIVGLCACIFAFIQAYAAALQGRNKSVLSSFVQNVSVALIFIVLVLVVDVAPKATNFIILYLVSLCGSLVMGIYFWYRQSEAKLVKVSIFPKALKASLYPLFIVTLMNMVVQWSGQFAIARYLDASDLAYFATAQRTALLTSFVLIAVNFVVAPQFAKAFSMQCDDQINRLSLHSSRLMIMLATPILMFMLIFPKWIMGMFGDEYIVAAPILKIMVLGQFVNVLTGSVGYLLTMTHHEVDLRNIMLFSGVLAIILSFILTANFGLLGAAYSTVISISVTNFLAVYFVKKRLGFNSLNIFRNVL